MRLLQAMQPVRVRLRPQALLTAMPRLPAWLAPAQSLVGPRLAPLWRLVGTIASRPQGRRPSSHPRRRAETLDDCKHDGQLLRGSYLLLLSPSDSILPNLLPMNKSNLQTKPHLHRLARDTFGDNNNVLRRAASQEYSDVN